MISNCTPAERSRVYLNDLYCSGLLQLLLLNRFATLYLLTLWISPQKSRSDHKLRFCAFHACCFPPTVCRLSRQTGSDCERSFAAGLVEKQMQVNVTAVVKHSSRSKHIAKNFGKITQNFLAHKIGENYTRATAPKDWLFQIMCNTLYVTFLSFSFVNDSVYSKIAPLEVAIPELRKRGRALHGQGKSRSGKHNVFPSWWFSVVFED